MKLRRSEQFRRGPGPLLWSVLVTALACTAPDAPGRRPVHDPWEGRGRECVRPFLGRGSPYREAEASELPDPLLDSVLAESHLTMTAAGLGPLVTRALKGKLEQGPLSLELLALRQDLGMRLISLE